MHKKNLKKLFLTRETLRMIREPELKQAVGGLTQSCPMDSYCACTYSDP